MKTDLTKAKDMLDSGKYTCVLCKGDAVYTSTERGVKPLLGWLDSGTDLKGFGAADKVVGKAAAFLYVLLGVDEVYAYVMSESAVKTFAEYGIRTQCDTCVKAIRNRTDTGFCPMEEAVSDIDEPQQAKNAVLDRLAQMNSR